MLSTRLEVLKNGSVEVVIAAKDKSMVEACSALESMFVVLGVSSPEGAEVMVGVVVASIVSVSSVLDSTSVALEVLKKGDVDVMSDARVEPIVNISSVLGLISASLELVESEDIELVRGVGVASIVRANSVLESTSVVVELKYVVPPRTQPRAQNSCLYTWVFSVAPQNRVEFPRHGESQFKSPTGSSEGGEALHVQVLPTRSV